MEFWHWSQGVLLLISRLASSSIPMQQRPRNVNPATPMATHQTTDQNVLLYEVDFCLGRLPSWISIDLMSATQNL